MEKLIITYKGKPLNSGNYPGSYATKMQMQSITKHRVSESEDCTDAFTKLYKKYYVPAMETTDPTIRDKGVLEFIEMCEGVAGVKLPQNDIKNIIRQCKEPKRMKINKFGRFFGRRPNKEMDMLGEVIFK